MVHLVRLGQHGADKVTTPIEEPLANQAHWPGQDLAMVVAHDGTGGRNTPSHWFCVVKVPGAWWMVDTGARGAITRENPFETQMGSRRRFGFTIDMLISK